MTRRLTLDDEWMTAKTREPTDRGTDRELRTHTHKATKNDYVPPNEMTGPGTATTTKGEMTGGGDRRPVSQQWSTHKVCDYYKPANLSTPLAPLPILAAASR